MTPERAKELAEANGCTFKEVPHNDPLCYPTYEVSRLGGWSDYYTGDVLAKATEADFIASLPDKRD